MTSEQPSAPSALSRLAEATTRPYVLLALGVLSVIGMGAVLRTTFQSIDLGIDRIAKVPLVVSLGLCLVSRVINAYGWSLSVRALGQRIGGAQGFVSGYYLSPAAGSQEASGASDRGPSWP